MDSTRRTLALFLVLSFGHVVLLSVQVQARSGVPLLQAAAFNVFAGVQYITSGMADMGRSFWTNYVALRGVVAENETLQQRVLQLEGQVQAEMAVAAQARELERLLNLQQTLVEPTLAARVIAGDPVPGALTITINRGTADGIRTNMPVIGHAGIVGRVINQPTAHAAQVQLLIGHNAGAGAITERSEAVGFVRGGAGNPPLELSYVDLLREVQVGERVLTSGIDDIFPRGFLIGTIERVVAGSGSGTYSEIAVRPAEDFSNLRIVLVILTDPPDGSEPDGGA